MNALVVYESMFGNTRAVAEAVAAGLGSSTTVSIFEVSTAPVLFTDDFDLLVVGGPTHAFGMSRESTRRSAVEQGAPAARAEVGIREWMERITPGARLRLGTAFDTRIDHPRVPGSAARKASRRLQRMGLELASPAESFFVSGVSGPLLEGELDRARKWGESLHTRARKLEPA